MPEQAARASAGPRAEETPTRDPNCVTPETFTPPAKGTQTAPGDWTVQAMPDLSPGLERARLADPPRRTIVIRGQVADRYSAPGHDSGRHRVPGPYGLGLRPERAALWAVLLGFALVIVALVSAHV